MTRTMQDIVAGGVDPGREEILPHKAAAVSARGYNNANA